MMKTSLLIGSVFTLFVGLIHSHAQAKGPGISGGGDHIPVLAGVAWFQDPARKINACIERSTDFPVNASEAAATLQESFNVWVDYLKDRRVDSVLPRFSQQINVSVNCTGNEELVVYLGVESAKVKAEIGKYFDPLSFVKFEGFDANDFGRGFIFVAGKSKQAQILDGDDLSKKFLLRGVLVHEMGHVFGNDHLDGTIMRESIVEFLKEAARKSDATRDVMMRSVDWTSQIAGRFYDFVYKGGPVPAGYMNCEFPRDLKNSQCQWTVSAYKEIIGRNPEGEVRGTIESKFNPVDFHKKLMKLTLTDARSTEVFDLNFEEAQVSVDSGAKFFKTGVPGSGNSGQPGSTWQGTKNVAWSLATSSTSIGTIVTRSGVKLRLVMTRGFGQQSIFQLGYLTPTSEYQATPIFYAYPGDLDPKQF